MSSVPSHLDHAPLRRSIGAASTLARLGLRSAEALTFWAAILLPVTYLPLLFGGLGGSEALLFAGLLACNVFALVAGHNHGRE
jgi:hypothetical protein